MVAGVSEVHPPGLRRAAGAVGDPKLHAEGLRRPPDGSTERAVAHDAKPPAAQFPDRVLEKAELLALLPGARADEGVVLPQTMGEQQKHPHHVLHDRRRAVVAQVADGHGVFAGRIEVDVVGAGGGERDQFQRRCRGDGLAAYPELVDEYGPGARDRRGDTRLRRLRTKLELRERTQETRRVEVVAVADRGIVEKHGPHGSGSQGPGINETWKTFSRQGLTLVKRRRAGAGRLAPIF